MNVSGWLVNDIERCEAYTGCNDTAHNDDIFTALSLDATDERRYDGITGTQPTHFTADGVKERRRLLQQVGVGEWPRSDSSSSVIRSECCNEPFSRSSCSVRGRREEAASEVDAEDGAADSSSSALCRALVMLSLVFLNSLL